MQQLHDSVDSYYAGRDLDMADLSTSANNEGVWVLLSIVELFNCIFVLIVLPVSLIGLLGLGPAR